MQEYQHKELVNNLSIKFPDEESNFEIILYGSV